MTKAFFDEARIIAGGKLTQKQVDTLNKVITDLTPVQAVKKLSASGIKLIRSFESLELEAYDDGVGVWTIGFGTTIANGVKVKKGDVCTLEQAVAYMTNDLKRFEQTVNSAVTVPLNQNQYDALVSLTYNIGQNAFNNSTLLKKLNTKDYKGAAAQFDVWNKAGGKVMKGLVNRRAVERKLFETLI
ncbi:lysozyme [Acinetobacter sp. WCHAc060025]|uniref:lysozyme n=1 Tax=Acinetobacter sp. WCHAc060025 TaxID=2518625 RepID=UPI0010233472|nr:lysozyme [Acinetobacter sp. WCHAc060025]RZG74806.1 lysozyme [Acinetobacter sp. WCHAc060025]